MRFGQAMLIQMQLEAGKSVLICCHGGNIWAKQWGKELVRVRFIPQTIQGRRPTLLVFADELPS